MDVVGNDQGVDSTFGQPSLGHFGVGPVRQGRIFHHVFCRQHAAEATGLVQAYSYSTDEA